MSNYTSSERDDENATTLKKKKKKKKKSICMKYVKFLKLIRYKELVQVIRK